MNNLSRAILLISIVLVTMNVQSQNPKVEMPGTQVLKFTSAINGKEYVLHIQFPDSYRDSDKKYPVLYLLDGQWNFSGITNIQAGLYYDGLIPEMIIVGITWPGDYDNNRARDFSPTPVKEYTNSGGAPKFLLVLKNEIIRRVDSSYRTQSNNNALLGGSFSGLFALYALFQQPALFNRYIIASPALDYDDGMIYNYEKLFSQKNKALKAKVFMCYGEYEDQVNYGYYFNKFIDQLKTSNYKGIELETTVLEKLGHTSACRFDGVKGLAYVFGEPEIVVDTVLLNGYTGHYLLNSDSVMVTRTDNTLYLNYAGGRIRLYAKSNEIFYTKGLGTGSTGPQFLRDNMGKVSGYNISYGGNNMFAKKID